MCQVNVLNDTSLKILYPDLFFRNFCCALKNNFQSTYHKTEKKFWLEFFANHVSVSSCTLSRAVLFDWKSYYEHFDGKLTKKSKFISLCKSKIKKEKKKLYTAFFISISLIVYLLNFNFLIMVYCVNLHLIMK